jgi:hypothetical protein
MLGGHHPPPVDSDLWPSTQRHRQASSVPRNQGDGAQGVGRQQNICKLPKDMEAKREKMHAVHDVELFRSAPCPPAVYFTDATNHSHTATQATPDLTHQVRACMEGGKEGRGGEGTARGS